MSERTTSTSPRDPRLPSPSFAPSPSLLSCSSSVPPCLPNYVPNPKLVPAHTQTRAPTSECVSSSRKARLSLCVTPSSSLLNPRMPKVTSTTKPLKPYRRGETLGKASRAGKLPRAAPKAVGEKSASTEMEAEDEEEEEVGGELGEGGEVEVKEKRKSGKKGKKFVESQVRLSRRGLLIDADARSAPAPLRSLFVRWIRMLYFLSWLRSRGRRTQKRRRSSPRPFVPPPPPPTSLTPVPSL